MKLDSLAVYWNSTGSKSYLKLDKKDWFNEMLKNVASASNRTDYTYCEFTFTLNQCQGQG